MKVFERVPISHLSDWFVNRVISDFYMVEGRHYHNVDHIRDLFNTAAKLDLKLTPSQELAVLFHDAIYVPGSDYNERQSAALMVSRVGADPTCLKYRCYDDVIQGVVDDAVKIILSTKQHLPLCLNADVVIDLDLSGFLHWSKLMADTELIYKEYFGILMLECGDAVKARRAFDEGRLRFLRKFRDSRAKFFTSQAFAMHEDIAMINLKAAIGRLECELETIKETIDA